LFDDQGRRLPQTIAAEQYRVSYGNDGKAELAPSDLLGAVTRARNRTLRSYRSFERRARLPIRAIGGSALWHALLGLDRKLRPVTPIFTWADSRAASEARQLRERFDERHVHQRTGCMLRSTFWPAKLRWLRRSQLKLFRQIAYWVSPSDWIFAKFLGELNCSASMASGTGLFNLTTNTWDPEMVEACQIDVTALPRIVDRMEPRRRTGPAIELAFCPLGDGAASNLGSGADHLKMAAINVGTSAAVRTIQNARDALRKQLPFGLFRYAVDPTRMIIGGATSNAGNLRRWCLRELRIEENSHVLDRALSSRKAAATDSLTILPFWVEERAPTWPEGQLGVIDGLNQATTAAEIARSSATAVFYRLRDIMDKMEISLGRPERVIVSGGILQSRASLALLADSIGRDLEISAEPEASLRGAAVHALTQLGKNITTPRSRKILRHDPTLGAQHRKRRKKQERLERILVSRGRKGTF
jgi:gluconokinase